MNVNFEQLVKKARKGDQDAMTDLYAATSQQVYFAALKLLGNQEDAEDIASETYITAFSNLDRLADGAAFGKWVRVIAVNLAKDLLKKKKPVLFSTDEEEQRILGSVREESEDCLPEEFAQREELRRQVVAIIDELPEAQRATVYLHYMEGHSVEEVAEIMEVNENTVKSRLNYARNKLRKLAERSGLTLGAVSVITLALRAECAATAVPFAVNKAVMGAIGSLGAAMAAAGGAAGTAAAGAAAGTAAKVGIGAKIAAMGIGTKIAAIAAAGALLVAGGIGISKVAVKEEVDPAEAFMEIVEENGGFEGLIGKTGDEIIEIFGDEFDYTERRNDGFIDYHLDSTVSFFFVSEIKQDTPCVGMFFHSAKVTLPELYGADREGVMKYISDNGFAWSEDEPAEFDYGPGIGDDNAEFIIFIYDDNIRYTAVSDGEGAVRYVSILDHVLYKKEFDKEMNAAEPEPQPGMQSELYHVSHEFYVAGESESEDSITSEPIEVWENENVEDIAAGIEKVYEGGEKNYRYVRTEIDYETCRIYIIYEREEPVDIMQLYENVSGYKGTRTARILVDVTRDGVPELIVISTDEVSGWVNVYTVKNREAVNIWQYTSGSTVRDNDSICLYEKGGYYYFLTLDLQNDNGNVDYGYKAFWLDENGAEQEIFSDRFVGKFSDSRSMELIADYNELIKDVVVDMLVGDSRGIFHYSGDTTFCDLDFAGSNVEYGYSSSVAEGTYNVTLTGDFTEVDGGVMAKANQVKYVYLTDSQLRALKPGDVVDLTYAGYGTVTVEKVMIDGNYAEIEEYGDCLWLSDGKWYFEYPSGVRYSYSGEAMELFFPKGLKITDWSSGNGMNPDIRDDIRDIPSWSYGNGMSVTVKNGAVTEATLMFSP